jgi:hypothetical protein
MSQVVPASSLRSSTGSVGPNSSSSNEVPTRSVSGSVGCTARPWKWVTSVGMSARAAKVPPPSSERATNSESVT